MDMVFCFFFSSRRRHTRWPRDWSSDVCSSDLDDGECTIDVPGEGRRYVDVRFPIGADGRTWIGGFAIDVSERTRAQRALRERTDELDALLRHLPFPVWSRADPIVRTSAATAPHGRCRPAI